MKGYGYIRVSSVEQTKGTSLTEQKRQIEAYAILKEIELLGVLVDPAIKGEVPIHHRPNGKILVEAIKTGDIDCVVVTKLDRAFRSASDCLVTVEAWEKKNIGLHILNIGGQTIDTTTPTGKFFLTIMAGAAELEKNLIKERCASGREARRAEGKRIGEIPFGMDLGPDEKTLVLNHSEQEVLSIIRRQKNRGKTLQSIADEHNSRGYSTKKDKKWTPGIVWNLLKAA
jgi:site-specific DNA recombinase